MRVLVCGSFSFLLDGVSVMLFSFVCRLCANSCYILSNPAPPHQIDQYVPTYGSSHPTEAANNSQTITQRAQCQFPSTPYWACSLLLATLRTYLYVIMATKHHPSYLSQHYVRLACQEGLSETFDGLAIILTEVKWKESKRGRLVTCCWSSYDFISDTSGNMTAWFGKYSYRN